jgi:hypothetical protein
MRDTNDGGWVLDASAHLLSHALVSQSASISCCTLARVVVLFVFMVYCVNVVFAWSRLLIFSITGVLIHGKWTSQMTGSTQAVQRACVKSFSYFKCEADAGMPVHDVAKAQECTAEACDISNGSVQKIISEGNVAICVFFFLCAPPAFVRVCHFSALRPLALGPMPPHPKWVPAFFPRGRAVRA